MGSLERSDRVAAPVTPITAQPRYRSSSPARLSRPSAQGSVLSVVAKGHADVADIAEPGQEFSAEDVEQPEPTMVVNVSGLALRAEACCPGGHRLHAEKAVDDLFECDECKDDVFKEVRDLRHTFAVTRCVSLAFGHEQPADSGRVLS